MKISLITVCYNSAATIRDTFDSVLNQTYPYIEYIVVDGKSTDDTVAIIKEYEPQFNGRMHWISEPDKGLYDAMNKGIKMATGDVVGIINSDDFYHRNDTIEKVALAFVSDKDIQAIFGDIRFVYPHKLDKTVRYYSSRKCTPRLFRFGFMPAHPTFFTYKENFEKYGYYKTDYVIAADYELLIRFLYTNKISYKYLPIDFMKMRIGGHSTTSFKSTIILNKEIIRGCKQNGIYTNMGILFLKYFIKIFELILVNQ
jgi:glycosyltransferase involved in cell wall biosynthesis